MKYVHPNLKKDKSIVLEAVKSNGNALEYADESLKKDKFIAYSAVQERQSAIKFVDISIKKEIEEKQLSFFNKRLIANRKRLK